MYKATIGLAAIFAVLVAVVMFMDFLDDFEGFGTDTETRTSLSTRYSASVQNSLDDEKTEEGSADEEELFTYRNTGYDYSLEYPDGILIGCEKRGESIRESPVLCFYIASEGDEYDAPSLLVDVREPEFFSSRYEDELEQRLIDYAESVWELNRRNRSGGKETSGLTKIRVGGRTAYKFTTTKKYITETDTERLDDEAVIIFVDNRRGTKFNFVYPEREEVLEDILATFRFL